MSNIDKEAIIIIVSLLLTTLIVIIIKFCNCNKIKLNKTINYETI